MIQPPLAIGLMLCEQVIVEEKTHNVTLVNCSDRLKVRKVPSAPQRLVLFALLTNGLGAGTFRLTISRPDTLEEILSKEMQATFPNPLQIVRFTVRDSLSFPIAGRYQISLLADGQLITQRAFQVSVTEKTS